MSSYQDVFITKMQGGGHQTELQTLGGALKEMNRSLNKQFEAVNKKSEAMNSKIIGGPKWPTGGLVPG